MVDKINMIIINKTWELVARPLSKNIIGLKWVYIINLDTKNIFKMHKARLIVKGYSQIAGLDFEKTFTPII